MTPDDFPAAVAQVERLHKLYEHITSFSLRLDYARIRAWRDYMVAGFTEADLSLVCGYLRKKIAAGDRNPGSLKFSNLISQLDRFEEDLNLARAECRITDRRTPGHRPLPEGWQDYVRREYPDAVIPNDPANLPPWLQAEIRQNLRK